MSSKQIEFLVKLRDALSEYLDTLAPPGVKEEKPAVLPGTENLKDLPWKSYATKQAANQDEAAWIFANTQGAESLNAALKVKDRVQIGSFEFSRSGQEKQFISRKPVK